MPVQKYVQFSKRLECKARLCSKCFSSKCILFATIVLGRVTSFLILKDMKNAFITIIEYCYVGFCKYCHKCMKFHF